MLRGTAVIVLHKIQIEPHVAERLAIPRLKEKAARISEDLRLQKPRIVNFGL